MPKTATDHQRIRVRRRSTTALNASLHIRTLNIDRPYEFLTANVFFSKKGSLHDMVHRQIPVDNRNSYA